MSSQWWRRNRWALPAMLIALAGLAWPWSEPARDVWWPGSPHNGHQPSDDGWASLANAQIRLADFARVDTVPEDDFDEASPIPDDYQVWRAELKVKASSGGSRICDLELQDAAGRIYAAGSYHVPSFDDESIAIECGAGDDPGGVGYFLVPSDAEPATIRVVATELNPDFWELPVSGVR